METERRVRAEAAEWAAQNGNFSVAKDQVIDLIAEDWNCAEGHRAWGRVLQLERKYSDAIASFRTAATLRPEDPELLFEYAAAMVDAAQAAQLLQLTDWSEARHAVMRGLELAPATTVGVKLLRFIDEQSSLVLD